MKIRRFLNIVNIITPESAEAIKAAKKPARLCGKDTPNTINDITMGQLLQLQDIKTMEDVLFVPAFVLLGIEKEEILKAEVGSVFGFSNWVAREVTRISKLFESTNVPPTSDEVMAGAKQMKFGAFGIIDSYARRMGITNHEEVESVPWVRVYKCMDIDAQKARFDRRLRNILMKKKK